MLVPKFGLKLETHIKFDNLLIVLTVFTASPYAFDSQTKNRIIQLHSTWKQKIESYIIQPVPV